MIALKITPAGDISCVNVRNLAQLSKVLNGSSSFVLNNDYRFRVYFSDFCKYIKLPINNLANIILKFFAIDDYLSGDCYITSIDTNGGKSTSLSYSQIDFLYSIVGLYNPNNYYQNYFSNIDLARDAVSHPSYMPPYLLFQYGKIRDESQDFAVPYGTFRNRCHA